MQEAGKGRGGAGEEGGRKEAGAGGPGARTRRERELQSAGVVQDEFDIVEGG